MSALSARRCCALFASALVLSGCPTFEDERSGTYRELPTSSNVSGELLELELFRFGDYSKAIVRTYRSSLSEEPFSRQISCAWTDLAAAPDDQGKLRLRLAPSAEQQTEQIDMQGQFIDDQELELTLRYPRAQPPRAAAQKRFRRYRSEPNNRCDTVGLYTITLKFDLEGGAVPNQLPPETAYTMRRPTFIALWLGVKAQRQGDSIVWVANQSARHPIALNPFNLLERGLTGDLTLSISSPDEEMLVASGSTRYALAHPVIVDDACARDPADMSRCLPMGEDERFSWEPGAEPILATALELGQEPGPDFPPTAEGLGKAILFVEGKLSELHPNLQSEIVHIERYTDNARYNSRHFYLVDVFFDDNDIVGMRLPADPNALFTSSYRNITLKMTRDYLNARQIPLPRRKPIDETF